LLEDIPDRVKRVLAALSDCGHSAYVVGGACRDLLSGLVPHDWDVATSATPHEVEGCLAGRYSLVKQGEKHGTTGVVGHGEDGDWLVEVTTFRTESTYSDGRRPDKVEFVQSVEQDLSRRDFSVNAIAVRWPGLDIVDPFGGAADLAKGIIRCVGDPARRFSEDGLRLLRALRLEAERGWTIEKATYAALVSQSRLLARVSKERIREEFSRILVGQSAPRALRDMVRTGLLERFIPEFSEAIGLDQRTPYHKRKLDEHLIETVSWVRPDLVVRLAALFHDVAKPRTFMLDDVGQGHFYGHNKAGAEMTAEILRRLRYDKDTIQRVSLLVREHMFAYGPIISDAGVRRLIGRVGKDNLPDLFDLRRADIIASGGLPDPLLDHMWERVVRAMEGGEPTSAMDLAVDGDDVMDRTGWAPGPRVGRVLAKLFDLVIEYPEKNQRDLLLGLIESVAGTIERDEKPDGTERSGAY